MTRYFNPEYLGKKIRELRTSKSLTQEELAEIIGVTRNTIRNYERGRTFPREFAFNALYEYFDVDPEVFLERGEF